MLKLGFLRALSVTGICTGAVLSPIVASADTIQSRTTDVQVYAAGTVQTYHGMGINHEVYLPVWWVVQTVMKCGVSATWNGSSLTLSTPQSSITSQPDKIVMTNPDDGAATSYVSLRDVEIMLHRVGVLNLLLSNWHEEAVWIVQ